MPYSLLESSRLCSIFIHLSERYPEAQIKPGAIHQPEGIAIVFG